MLIILKLLFFYFSFPVVSVVLFYLDCFYHFLLFFVFFFFQAEDGIRDLTVMEFRRVLFRSNDLEHPGTGVPHELPDGDRSPLIVLDHSRLDDLGIDKGDSTHHAVTFETGEETIFGIHAILQGQQDRVWGHHRRDLVHHVIQVVSLDRQDDQVRLWEIARIGGRRRPYREGTLGAADREAMLSGPLKRPWPEQEGDAGIMCGQVRAEKSADRAGSDHHHLLHPRLHLFSRPRVGLL